MKIPLEFFILAAAVIGAAIGFFTASIFATSKLRRIEKKTWNQARVFYTRRAASHIIR